jgi:hypothetical protein
MTGSMSHLLVATNFAVRTGDCSGDDPDMVAPTTLSIGKCDHDPLDHLLGYLLYHEQAIIGSGRGGAPLKIIIVRSTPAPYMTGGTLYQKGIITHG